MSVDNSTVGRQLLTMALEAGDGRLARLAVRVLAETSVSVRDVLREIPPTSGTTSLKIKWAAEGLAEAGESDALEWLLQHPSPDVRTHVANLLSKYRSSAPVKTLERFGSLTEQDRIIIALASGDELTERDAPELVEVFQSRASSLQALARLELTRLGKPGVLAIAGFIDHAPTERQSVAMWKLLFDLDQSASLRCLRARVDRKRMLLRYALDFLVRASNPEAAAIAVEALRVENDRSTQDSTRDAIAQLGAVAVEPLIIAFRQDSRIREREADLLARLGGKAVIEELVSVLTDPDSSATLHQACEQALSKLGTAPANVLAREYSRSSDDMRPKLMRALASTHAPEAIRLLQVDATRRGPLQVPATVALGLDASEEARQIVLEATRAEQPDIRAAAADALSEWDLEHAVPPLQSLAVDVSAEVTARAFRALERLVERDWRGSRHITWALVKIANAPGIQDSDSHRRLFDFLGKIGDVGTLAKAVTGAWASPHIKPHIVSAIAARKRLEWERRRDVLHGLARVRDPGAKPPPPDAVTDNVHFSVVAPGVVAGGKDFLLDVWAHENAMHRVLGEAQRQLGTERMSARSVGPKPVRRGTQLRVVVSMPQLRFEDEEDLYWDGQPANASFLVPVPQGIGHGLQTGTIGLLIGPLRLARLHFCVRVADSTTVPEDQTLFEERFKSAFACYASEDRQRVLGRIQGMLKQAPTLKVFLDVLSLRSGENWQQRIESEIASRDIFYLFWSKSAKESPWVEREWRYALEQKGLECIDPVPLDSPANAPPPAELASLHFNDWMLLV